MLEQTVLGQVNAFQYFHKKSTFVEQYHSRLEYTFSAILQQTYES
jgi:hypothetical protein